MGGYLLLMPHYKHKKSHAKCTAPFYLYGLCLNVYRLFYAFLVHATSLVVDVVLLQDGP